MASARHVATIATGIAFLVLSAPSAWAQALDVPMVVTGAHRTDTWVSLHYAHQFETDIDDTATEMERDSVQLIAGHRFQMTDDLFLVGNIAYQGSYYDFSKNNDPAQLVWNDIHQATLLMGFGWKPSENWALVGLLLGRTSGESGADFGDTLTGGGGLAIDYTWSENLSTGVILGVMSQLEDSAAIIPVPTIDWRFAEDWRFEFGIVEMAYPGVGPVISYNPGSWSFALGGSFQKRRYRLDDRLGPINEGIGQEQSFPVFFRAGFMPTPKVNLAFMVGTALGGKIRSEQNGGARIFERSYDPALILGLQAGVRF